MATPFTEDGYTDQEADAIHQTIKVYLKPDIRWDRLLDEITDEIGSVCTQAQVLYTGDIQRRLKTTALEAFLRAYDTWGEPLQWHVQRQLYDYVAISDEGTPPNPMEITMVWDRWNARTCMTGVATSQKMLCTLDEMDQFGRKKP